MIRLRAERPRNGGSIPGMDKRNIIRLPSVQAECRAHISFYSMVTVGVKRPGEVANHLPVTSDEFRNE